MKIFKLRFRIQLITFVILTYGGRIGLNFSHALPCFACPYVSGCAGHCYLMALQGSFWGFQIQLTQIFSVWGIRALGMLVLFIVLSLLLSKTWCGWICPFGTLQDWITSLRKKMGIRESRFSYRFRDRLKPVKYILLVLLIVIPVLIENAGMHSDYRLPFCQICPAKPIMPLFEGNFQYFSVDTTNTITIAMTMVSLILAAFFLVGMFFKDRFFCIFCPMLALLSLIEKAGFLKLKKNVDGCIGCGSCQRVCTMDIRAVHMERIKSDVQTQDCMLCMKCAESCSQDNVLYITFLGKRLFSSSRNYVSGIFSKIKR